MTVSALDGVPGLGQSRKAALLKHFGSLKRLREATVDEISGVPGIGAHTAAAGTQSPHWQPKRRRHGSPAYVIAERTHREAQTESRGRAWRSRW